MSYRNCIDENVKETFQLIAMANNKVKLEAARLKASKHIAYLTKDVLKKVKLAAEDGKFYIVYKPPFWNPRYWFSWDKTMLYILIEELEKKNFNCGETISGKLQVSWGDQ